MKPDAAAGLHVNPNERDRGLLVLGAFEFLCVAIARQRMSIKDRIVHGASTEIKSLSSRVSLSSLSIDSYRDQRYRKDCNSHTDHLQSIHMLRGDQPGQDGRHRGIKRS
jgi:hypothetical protein